MSNPNDIDPDGDIVLRSSDNVQFRVRKSVLSLASPVFSDILSVPQSETTSDLPIDLSESSETIKLILTLCHPYCPFTLLHICSLSSIANLLQAADKYDIKTIQKHALDSLKQPNFLESEPLRVYAIASRYGAYDTAALAARHVLRFPLLHATYFSELEIVDGGTIYRISQYHKRCTAAVLEVATDHTWIRDGTYVFIDCPEADSADGEDKDEDDNDDGNKGLETRITTIRTHPSRKHKNGYLKCVSVHPWWMKFMATTKVALSESISPETIRDNGRVMEAFSSASRCSHCRRHVKSDFTQFLEAFVNEMEERVNEIKLVQPSAGFLGR